MQKYILSGLTSAAALLLVVSPVSAFGFGGGFPFPQQSSGGVEILNQAKVDNYVSVDANTGDNTQTLGASLRGSGRLELKNTMFTGDATAVGEVMNQVNIGDDCGCVPTRSKLKINNDADVDTDLEVKADTGDNKQEIDASLSEQSNKTPKYTKYFGRHSKPALKKSSSSLKAENYMETGNAEAGGYVWNVVNSDYLMVQ